MDRQQTPAPPGWYPDERDPSLVRFWDGRQWTARTSPAYPPPPGVQANGGAGVSRRPRWRSLRTRTKVLLVVGALVVFGAVMPNDDLEPAGNTQPSHHSGSSTHEAAEPEAADEAAPVDEDVENDVVEEPEEVIEEISVPALRSQSISEARNALRKAGLKLKVVRQPSWRPVGEVLKQGTQAGVALLAGQVVTLVVAAPMPRVPGVLGQGAAAGQAALTRAGFKVNIVEKVVSSGSNNVVLSQTPSGTDQAAPGSVVQLVVSNVVAPPPPPPSPTPVPLASNCTTGYRPCLTPAPDYDCAGGSGDGPRYAYGPIYITGSDPYDLDNDGDGVACES